MVSKEYIGLDLGKARTGIARASAQARLAQPLSAVPTNELITKLREIARTEEIEALVVGLPRGLEGQETKQTDWVRQWASQLKTDINLPIYAQDEALTTKLAQSRRFGGKDSHDEDAVAAAIILQDFLDSAEDKRVLL